MSEELKACPCCGSNDIDGGLWGNCMNCGAEEPLYNDNITWNTRRAPWTRVTPKTMPDENVEVFLFTKEKEVHKGSREWLEKDVYVWYVSGRMAFDFKWVTHWLPIDWLPLPKENERSNT